jgi:hypothetical protein
MSRFEVTAYKNDSRTNFPFESGIVEIKQDGKLSDTVGLSAFNVVARYNQEIREAAKAETSNLMFVDEIKLDNVVAQRAYFDLKPKAR